MAEKFGEGVMVDMVEVEERTTKAPQGLMERLDKVVTYNHKAIRIITPDGESFIVDYWQALHHERSTDGLMKPEQRFTEGWNRNLGGDSLFGGNLQIYHAEQNKLPALIEQYGHKQGLATWQSKTEALIHEADLSPDKKEQNLKTASAPCKLPAQRRRKDRLLDFMSPQKRGHEV
jgi:hypothetical protein